MTTYRYRALDAAGVSVAGEIDAEDRQEAAARLRASGVFPTDLEGPAAGSEFARAQAPRRLRLSRMQVAWLTRQLADLVCSGIPLHRCLSILSEQAAGRQRAVLEAARQEVQRGAALSEALRLCGGGFSTLYVEMVRAGESSGHLDAVLARLADYLEHQEARRAQVLSALTYPTVVLMVAAGAIAFMVTFLVPRLSVVFADIGQALPAPTRFLLAVAHGAPRVAPWLAGAVVAAYLAGRKAASTPRIGRALDAALLRAPLLGSLLGHAVRSRFARTLGTLLSGGVPLLEALEIAGAAAGNRAVRAAAGEMQQRVREGEPLSRALSEKPYFPPALVQMAAVGEETGDLPSMLVRYADGADSRFDHAMRRLTNLLEPAVLLVMGGVVAFVVLSVLLPVFEIYSAVDLSGGSP